MASILANATQQCEDAAVRCYHVSIEVYRDNIRAKFLEWRNYRNAHPTAPYDAEDLRLRNAFYSHMINDMNLPWLAPNNGRYFTLGGDWNGQRCLNGSVLCQWTPGTGGQGYIPDPGQLGGEGGAQDYPVNPINPPLGPGEGPQPPTNPHCYTDSGIVSLLAQLQSDAYAAGLVVVAQLQPSSGPQDDPRFITDTALSVWDQPFVRMYNTYIDLWYNTHCGDAPPTQLSPTMPHPVPLPANPPQI